jgi:hypothetical protein
MISAVNDKALLCAILLIAGCSLPSFSRAHKEVAGAITGHYKEKSSGDTLDVQLLPGSKIKLHLTAYWPSDHPSSEDFPGGGHIGETDTTIPIKGGTAVYGTTEFGGKCKITFKFVGKNVVIEQDGDPNMCGYGMNVIATGTYTLLSKKPEF